MRTTGSPTQIPDVSSYAWMNAVSPSRRMTSPMSPAVPTFTTSAIRAPRMPLAMTVGPDTLLMIPLRPAF